MDNDIPNLPDGYRQRVEALVLDIMPMAEKVMDICEEFCGDSLVIGNGELRVRIDRKV